MKYLLIAVLAVTLSLAHVSPAQARDPAPVHCHATMRTNVSNRCSRDTMSKMSNTYERQPQQRPTRRIPNGR